MSKKNQSKYYNSRFTFDKRREDIWKNIAQYLRKEIPSNSKVLELGAGYCSFINNVEAKEKHAIDLCPEIMKYADKNVNARICSCTSLKKFKNNYFDVVFASNLFEHLSMTDFEKTITGVKRILKKNGKLILLQPNFKYAHKEYFDDYTHQSIFTDVSMSDYLMSKDFKIIKCVPKFLPFSMKSNAGKLHFLLKFYLLSPIKPLAKQMLIIASKK